LDEGADGSTPLPSDLVASFADPDSSAWAITVDYGDGTSAELFLGAAFTSLPLSHTYVNSGNFVVNVSVDDGNGGVGTGFMQLVISDVSAPALQVAAPGAAYEGGSVTLFADTSHDTDANDFHTYDWVGEGVVSDDGRSFTLNAADNGTYTVRAIVRDQSGNTSFVDVSVVVQNVAPTASGFYGGGTVDQGAAVTVGLDGGDDASAADLAAGLVYAFDFDGDGTYEVSGASPSAAHAYGEPGTYTVRGRVSDKDGGHSDYETSVVVRPSNTAPTATLVVTGAPADEGGTVGVSLEAASDSPADLAAGLVYSFDLDNDGVYETSGAASAVSRVFGDNGSYPVHARVTDRYGAHSDYSATVVVNNVAPTSSLVAPATGNEGAALAFGFGAVSDPSAADAAAGFTYAFDFDNDGAYELSGTSPNVTHVFDDNGKYTVRARVTDKDGGSTSYSAQVQVKNVSPKSPRFWDNNPKPEGSVVTVGFDAVSDPSGADTTAGFTYSYDFDNDGVYEVTGTSPTATHTFGDNGVFWVRGRVTDKDGGFEEYATDVEIYNVAPTARLVGGSTAVEGGSLTFRLEGAADPSAADLAAKLTYSFDLDGDGAYEVSGKTATSATRVFANDGTYTVRAKVTDKDGGSTVYTQVVQVSNAAPVVTSLNSSAATLGSARQGSSVNVTGSFKDAGVLDAHAAVIDWGDGTTSVPHLYENRGAGMFFGSHVYTSGGMFTVTVRVKDDAATPGLGTGTAKAIVSGVGLRNGVLEVIGTNDKDKVTLQVDKGALKVKGVLQQDPTFSLASVREVQVWLGAGNDKFDTQGTIGKPVYYNGSLYQSSTKGEGSVKTPKHGLFSDILVAA
jgi:PKD repeat protein